MSVRFESPLRNLCDVLTQIRDSAKQYQSTLKASEASTRAVLIDPILRALGWDTANTHMVEIEKSLGSVRADYVLSDVNREPKIIVEAKALGTGLDEKKLLLSLVQYAFQFELTEVFLTDGLVWHHYTDFQPKGLAPARQLDITQGNPVDVAAYFVQHLDAAKFWPIENTDLLAQRIDQLESLVATLQRQMPVQPSTTEARAGKPPTSASTSPVAAATIEAAAFIPNDVAFTNLDSVVDVTGTRPTYFRLPDGSIIPVKKWKEVLRESCKYALLTNGHIPIPLPDRAGKKVSLFSYTKPAAGLSFLTEQYKGKTIFIYLNYDANSCVSNAYHVLQYSTTKGKRTTAAVAVSSE